MFLVKLMNHDLSNVGWPHTLPPDKIHWKKHWKKDNYWHNQLKKVFYRAKSIEKYWKKIILTQWVWEKLFDRSAEHK